VTSSATNRQPVVPSSAKCTSRREPKRANHSRTDSRVAGVIRPRDNSPLRTSTIAYVICRRCTSNAHTIRIGTSSSSTVLNDPRALTRLCRGGPTTFHLYGAPWLQTVAISGKSPSGKSPETSENRCRGLPPVACDMVRRGSTVRVRIAAAQRRDPWVGTVLGRFVRHSHGPRSASGGATGSRDGSAGRLATRIVGGGHGRGDPD